MVKRTAKLSVLFGFYWIAACMVYSYAELFLKHFGFRTDQVGMIMALGYLAGMIVQPALAQAADRERRVTLRSGVAGCAAVGVAIAIAMPLCKSVLPVVAVLFGAMTCVTLASQPLVNAVGFHYINCGEPLDYSFARGAASVAYALASLLFGWIAKSNVEAMLWVYLAVNAAIFLLALWFAPHRSGVGEIRSGSSLFSVIRRYPRLVLFCVGYFVLNVPHMFINSYLASITSVTGGDMSVMIALAAVVEFPAMMAYSHVRRRIPDRVLLVASASVFLLKTGLLLLAATTSVGVWTVYASFALQMLCYAIFVPASSYYANDIADTADQVKGQMLLTESGLLSGMVSLLFGGLSIEHFGVPFSLLLCEGLTAIGVVLVALGVRKPKR